MIVDRDHIGFFGKMNSGKSTVMNLVTQQCTSIVDETPGTTADTKFSVCEIHGLGPVKLYDTAGIDERALLGEKKRAKVFSDLKECDLVVLVVNPATQEFSPENELLEFARDHDKQILIFYNLFSEDDRARVRLAADRMPLSVFYKSIAIDAKAEASRMPVIDFIRENFESKNFKIDLLPNVVRDGFYVLNIPMDSETPGGRYLRPQAMCEEFITRSWAFPVSYRMDLASARSADPAVVASERNRFDKVIAGLGKKPELVITDSQAMDVAGKWVPPDIPLTTFSIVMINYMSRGRLKSFVDGAASIGKLKKGDKVLIVEACNHSRVGEDIGTVQIPNYLSRNFPGVIVEHNFGREFQQNAALSQYSLIIHCGGCMISSQKLSARMRDLDALGVPYTNYGLFLSYMQGKDAMRRVVRPFGL